MSYSDPDLAARVRDRAPGGVDAVFDNVGGAMTRTAWDLLAPRGTLVSGPATGAVPAGSVVTSNQEAASGQLRAIATAVTDLGPWSVLGRQGHPLTPGR